MQFEKENKKETRTLGERVKSQEQLWRGKRSGREKNVARALSEGRMTRG
jgi:hypothetical protein